jgi:hypothetical protein
MKIDRLLSWISRVFVVASAILFVMGFVEWIPYRIGMNLWLGYNPSRFLELAAFALLPVIVILLRQIRDELKRL